MVYMTYKRGFTLIELLVALIVSSIILAAVATLAFAMSSVKDATDDTSSKQAQIRFATLRISELIRQCRLIYDISGSDIAIWKSDNDSNNEIDSNETVYIETGQDADYIQLREPGIDPVVLIPQCSNVQFALDVQPLSSRFLSISFDVVENNVAHHYQMNNVLRCWAGNLLSTDGQSIVSDDD